MKNFRDYLETKIIVTKKRVPYYVALVSQSFDLKATTCCICHFQTRICYHCYISNLQPFTNV